MIHACLADDAMDGAAPLTRGLQKSRGLKVTHDRSDVALRQLKVERDAAQRRSRVGGEVQQD